MACAIRSDHPTADSTEPLELGPGASVDHSLSKLSPDGVSRKVLVPVTRCSWEPPGVGDLGEH